MSAWRNDTGFVVLILWNGIANIKQALVCGQHTMNKVGTMLLTTVVRLLELSMYAISGDKDKTYPWLNLFVLKSAHRSMQ